MLPLDRCAFSLPFEWYLYRSSSLSYVPAMYRIILSRYLPLSILEHKTVYRMHL